MESIADVYAFLAAHPVTAAHTKAAVLIDLFKVLAADKWVTPAERDSILLCL